MRTIIILFISLMFIGCNLSNRDYNKITITNTNDSTKSVSAEVYYVDTIDFVVDAGVSDSLILSSIKNYTDSLRKDSIRRDSLQKINFRRITKIINGGYNGEADRIRIWENAKKVLK